MTLNMLLANIYDAVLEPLLFVVFALAFMMFVWGIVESIRDSESDDGRKKGKANMLWGIVGMLIMISVFGIVNIIIGTIGAEPPTNKPTVEQQFGGTIRDIEVE